MNLKTEFDLITVLAAIFGLVGGFYLIRSIVRSSVDEIVGMSGTYWGVNPVLLKTFSMQKMESAIGFAHVTLGGLCWLASVFFLIPAPSLNFAISFSLATIITLFFSSHFAIKVLYSRLFHAVNLKSFVNHLNGNIQSTSYDQFDDQKHIEYAKRLGLAHRLDLSLNNFENLQNLMKIAGDSAGAQKINEIARAKRGNK